MSKTEELTEELQKALWNIQSKVIGVFKNPYTNDFEMVIADHSYTFDTITIGTMFGLSVTTYTKGEFRPVLFSDNTDYETLSELMESPYDFREWCKTFM